MSTRYFCDRCNARFDKLYELIQYQRNPHNIPIKFELCKNCDTNFTRDFMNPPRASNG